MGETVCGLKKEKTSLRVTEKKKSGGQDHRIEERILRTLHPFFIL